MAGRRLFCFAMQSRSRRRKKAGVRPLRQTIEAQPPSRPDQPIESRTGRPGTNAKGEMAGIGNLPRVRQRHGTTAPTDLAQSVTPG